MYNLLHYFISVVAKSYFILCEIFNKLIVFTDWNIFVFVLFLVLDMGKEQKENPISFKNCFDFYSVLKISAFFFCSLVQYNIQYLDKLWSRINHASDTNFLVFSNIVLSLFTLTIRSEVTISKSYVTNQTKWLLHSK